MRDQNLKVLTAGGFANLCEQMNVSIATMFGIHMSTRAAPLLDELWKQPEGHPQGGWAPHAIAMPPGPVRLQANGTFENSSHYGNHAARLPA